MQCPSFSPLLVGSVVATHGVTSPLGRTLLGFSPLLVGSVVATGEGRYMMASEDLVSVPYWSGQWLQPAFFFNKEANMMFQSPIGRVSGCNRDPYAIANLGHRFQSPIGRVSGCNRLTRKMRVPAECVSVPYWSGQWLQLVQVRRARKEVKFQSPIGRVSGCNHDPENQVRFEDQVSVPYWSGQWLQP